MCADGFGEFVLGVVLGLVVGIMIFGVASNRWLSPKQIKGQLYYYGIDYNAPQNEECYYWKLTGKYRKQEVSTFTEIGDK